MALTEQDGTTMASDDLRLAREISDARDRVVQERDRATRERDEARAELEIVSRTSQMNAAAQMLALRERDEARAALAEVGRLLEALGDPCAYHESKLARVEALIATYDPDTNGGQDWIAGVKVATELSAAIKGDPAGITTYLDLSGDDS